MPNSLWPRAKRLTPWCVKSVTLLAVQTFDFMAADWAPLPHRCWLGFLRGILMKCAGLTGWCMTCRASRCRTGGSNSSLPFFFVRMQSNLPKPRLPIASKLGLSGILYA